jgi:hypothetical protein
MWIVCWQRVVSRRDGHRGLTVDGTTLLQDLLSRGLEVEEEILVIDGGKGTRKAPEDVFEGSGSDHNWMFAGSLDGARWAAIFLSLGPELPPLQPSRMGQSIRLLLSPPTFPTDPRGESTQPDLSICKGMRRECHG